MKKAIMVLIATISMLFGITLMAAAASLNTYGMSLYYYYYHNTGTMDGINTSESGYDSSKGYLSFKTGIDQYIGLSANSMTLGPSGTSKLSQTMKLTVTVPSILINNRPISFGFGDRYRRTRGSSGIYHYTLSAMDGIDMSMQLSSNVTGSVIWAPTSYGTTTWSTATPAGATAWSLNWAPNQKTWLNFQYYNVGTRVSSSKLPYVYMLDTGYRFNQFNSCYLDMQYYNVKTSKTSAVRTITTDNSTGTTTISTGSITSWDNAVDFDAYWGFTHNGKKIPYWFSFGGNLDNEEKVSWTSYTPQYSRYWISLGYTLNRYTSVIYDWGKEDATNYRYWDIYLKVVM